MTNLAPYGTKGWRASRLRMIVTVRGSLYNEMCLTIQDPGRRPRASTAPTDTLLAATCPAPISGAIPMLAGIRQDAIWLRWVLSPANAVNYNAKFQRHQNQMGHHHL